MDSFGRWLCNSCHHKRPVPDVIATEVDVMPTCSRFVLTYKGRSIDVLLPLPGLFNVYNALCAAACACQIGVTLEAIRQGLKDYKTLFGRSEKLVIDGKTVLIQLIKNPAGATQSIGALAADKNARAMIAINDNLADGRDISWLWDANFEMLARSKRPIIVSGRRAEDMAVRMKYAGLPQELIVCMPRLDKALDEALRSLESNETLWLLPTYTCLLELQKIVKARGLSLSGT